MIDKPNYTQIPNALLDNADKFKPSEFMVLMVICRKTFGWHKDKDVLSLSQLQDLTGLSRHTIISAVEGLEKAGVIVSRKTRNGTEYAVNVSGADFDSAEIAPMEVQNLHQTSAEIAPPVVQKLHTQKKEKETIQKKIKEMCNCPESREVFENKMQDVSIRYYSKPLTKECLNFMIEKMYLHYDPKNTGVWRYKGKLVKDWVSCCGTYLDPHGYSAGKLRFVEPEKTAKERWGQESVTAEEWAKNAPRLDGDDYFDYMKTEGK